MSETWTLTLPCTRAEAEALGEDWDFLARLNPPPSLVSEELTAFDESHWQIVAYFEGKPDDASISVLKARLPQAQGSDLQPKILPQQDWVTISQQGMEPVQIGRFFIHTQAGEAPPKDTKALRIEASRAFGTGHHETTGGCLAMLDAMERSGMRFRNFADIGTGSGLLAFAAHHLWPGAHGLASDIDPEAIAVAQKFAHANGIKLGSNRGQLTLVTASGTDHPQIRRHAPYDLLIANILAGPLVELAPAFATVIQAGGRLMLAGLLQSQSSAVIAAYRHQGFRLTAIQGNGDWPVLLFTMRRRYGYRRLLRSTGRSNQADGDTGEW